MLVRQCFSLPIKSKSPGSSAWSRMALDSMTSTCPHATIFHLSFSAILNVRHGRRPFHPPLHIDRLPLVFLILLFLLVLLFLLATLAWVALFIVVVGVMVSIIPASAKSGSPPRPAPSSRKHISLSSLLSLAKPRSSLLISLPIAAHPRPSQSAPPFSFEQQPSSEV
jgi:hypothetical protein